MYCIKCGVELADSEKSCPLCGTEVLLPEGQTRELTPPPYPPHPGAVTDGITRAGAMSVVTLLCLIPLVLCLLVDLKINGKPVWSGFASGAILLCYVVLFLPLWFRRANPVIFVPVDFACVGLYLAYINFAVGGRWFWSLAFPMLLASCLVTTAAVTLLRYVRGGKPFIFGGATILYGGIMVLLEHLIHCTFHQPIMIHWSIYPFVAFFLLGVFLLLVGIIRPLRESFRRKLFF